MKRMSVQAYLIIIFHVFIEVLLCQQAIFYLNKNEAYHQMEKSL